MSDRSLHRLIHTSHWMRGYPLDERECGIVYADGQRSGPMGTVRVSQDINDDPQAAVEEIFSQGGIPTVPEHGEIFVVLEGCDPQEAEAFFDAFEERAAAGGTQPVMRVVVDADGEVFTAPAGHGAPWGDRGQLSGTGEEVGTAKLAAQGLEAPAASRSEYMARFAKLDEPTFAPIGADDPAVEQIAGICPSERVELGAQLLDRLEAGQAAPAAAARDKAVLGHLVTDSKIVRDGILAHAAGSARGEQTLTQVAREAPDEYRLQMAAAAGCARLLSGSSSGSTEAMLSQGVVDGEPVNLAKLAGRFNRTGMDGREMLPDLVDMTREALDEGDRQWSAQRGAGVEAGDWASPVQATGPWAVSAGPEVE